MGKYRARDWAELFLNAIPPVDWAYAVANKECLIERREYARFRKGYVAGILVTLEHTLYGGISFATAYFWGLRANAVILALVVCALSIEFALMRAGVGLPTWKGLDELEPKWFLVLVAWNFVNVLAYWCLGLLAWRVLA